METTNLVILEIDWFCDLAVFSSVNKILLHAYIWIWLLNRFVAADTLHHQYFLVFVQQFNVRVFIISILWGSIFPCWSLLWSDTALNDDCIVNWLWLFICIAPQEHVLVGCLYFFRAMTYLHMPQHACWMSMTTTDL